MSALPLLAPIVSSRGRKRRTCSLPTTERERLPKGCVHVYEQLVTETDVVDGTRMLCEALAGDT
jgi:hypothetical protein